MTASIQVKEQRGLPQKFAGCVCVIINKHSFEPFMCLDLEKNLALKVQFFLNYQPFTDGSCLHQCA